MKIAAHRSVVVGFIVVTSVPAIGQSVFSSSYGVGYNNISWVRGVANPDGGFSISARPTDSTLTSFASSLLTIDSAGDPISAVRYEHGNSDLTTSMFHSADGHLFIGAMGAGPLAVQNALVRKCDGAGNVEWAKAYAHQGATETPFFDMVQIGSGDLIGVGKSDGGGDPDNPMLFRLDQSGNVIWAEQLSNDSAGIQCLALAPSPFGGVYLAGRYAPTGLLRMVLMHIDDQGAVLWAKWFGSTTVHCGADRVIVDPWSGLVLLGTRMNSGPGDGVAIRTDLDGNPASMFTWGTALKAGHAFADGSLMLMSENSDDCVFGRIAPDLGVDWNVDIEAGPDGQLIPFDEATRFAYVSSLMFSDVTVHTLTALCQTCSPGIPGFNTATDVWLDHGPMLVGVSPVQLLSIDVPMTQTSVIMTRSAICSADFTGVPDRYVAEVSRCGVDRRSGSVILSDDLAPGAEVRIADAFGHQWISGPNGTGNAGGTTVPWPATLSAGVYTASWLRGSERKACAFVHVH